MTARLLLAAAAVTALGVCASLWYRARAESMEAARDAMQVSLEAERVASARLRIQLDAERAAAQERAGREAAQAADREALKGELETCDLDPAWRVPDGLYERLCRGVAPVP